MLGVKRSLFAVCMVMIFCYAALPLVFAQQNGWQPLRQNMRPAVSFPTQPAPTSQTSSAMPRSRRHVHSQRQSDWVDMGNGARIRIPEQSKEDQIAPDILETIKQIKQEDSLPLYQLESNSYNFEKQSSDGRVTEALSQGLIAPGTFEQKVQRENVIESSISFRLPPEKNIRIRSLDFRQTSVQDALRSLAQLININLMLSPTIQGQLTILFSDVTIEEAFNTILSSYDLSHVWQGNILRIFPKADAPLVTRIFAVQHSSAIQIQPIIEKLLTENRGKIEVDIRTNSLMVTDTSEKLAEISRLLPQIDVEESAVDIRARPMTEVFYLNYADASALRAPIEMLAPDARIQEFSSSQASQAATGGDTGGRMDMMIITESQNNLSRVRELIDKLDVPPVQVTIDAHIFEIDKNEEERLGINWQKSIPIAGTGEDLLNINISPEADDTGGTGVFRFGSLNVNQFRAILSMLKTQSFARVLSNPVITTLNNREANITVGQAIPYISASQINADTGQVTNTIGQVNADISLIVTPSITGNDEVFLDIRPTISSVLGFTELGGNSTPNLSNRSAETQVIVKNNHTIVIGGMIKTDKSESVSKVPFFGDLPGIGRLFRRRSVRETRTELIIFITPHIIHRGADDSAYSAQQTGQFNPRLMIAQ